MGDEIMAHMDGQDRCPMNSSLRFMFYRVLILC